MDSTDIKFQEQEEQIEKQQLINRLDGSQLSSDAKDWLAAHEQARKECSQTLNRAIFAALSFSFTYMMRASIFVLYAREISNDTASNTIISIIVYLSYICSSIMCVAFGVIGDDWQFDHLFVIAAISDVITFLIEASAVDFTMLAVPYVVGGQPIQAIIVGYIHTFVSTADGKQLQLKYGQLYTVGLTFGVAFGGILAYYISYRAVFYCAFIMATLLTIHVFIFVANTQSKLKNIQIDLVNKFNINNIDKKCLDMLGSDHILPICKEKFKFEFSDDNEGSNINPNKSMVDTEKLGKKYPWFLIGLFMIMEGLTLGTDTAIPVWYTVYIKEKFNSNVIVSTAQISLSCLFFVIGAILMMSLIKGRQKKRDVDLKQQKQRSKYNFTNYFVLIIICCVIFEVFMCFFVFPNTSSYLFTYLYWIYLPVYVFVCAIAYSSEEAILVELIPKKVAGKGFGTKVAMTITLKAIPTLIIGCLWSNSIEWLWYTQGLIFSVVLICIVIVACCETCKVSKVAT